LRSGKTSSVRRPPQKSAKSGIFRIDIKNARAAKASFAPSRRSERARNDEKRIAFYRNGKRRGFSLRFWVFRRVNSAILPIKDTGNYRLQLFSKDDRRHFQKTAATKPHKPTGF
jgi:hypothetical protein